MVALVSRHGRSLQRYRAGRRLVVGCVFDLLDVLPSSRLRLGFSSFRSMGLIRRTRVPKKKKKCNLASSGERTLFKIDQALEVLVISSQKGPELMFPKGGWELDETLPAAAAREAFEEAGVTGNFEVRSFLASCVCLGYHHNHHQGPALIDKPIKQGELGKWLSEDRDKVHYMFAMRATEVLQQWPEMSRRERKWVTVAEARQVCKHPWMREALERLEELVSSGSRQEPRGGGGGLTALTVNSSL
ncbi:hypothetical protein ZIOFF_034465 [Zingiber officinale]|uniref:Nudix hydrolase domain-containing protein n=1 Tax=Zingiber officinale TaxID=94328 RepID=A0A8J5L2H8_ZINOF|nr:hypothetical protein ZIOFF_034465 [Zingiber officinale]